MSKSIQGTLAWMGVWICFCAIADYVLQIEANCWAMAFGVLAKEIACLVETWIKTEQAI